MAFNKRGFWFLTLATIVSRASSQKSTNPGLQSSEPSLKNIIPNHFIVQLKTPDENTRSGHADFETAAKQAGLTVNIKNNFTDLSVFHGVHLEILSESINETVKQLNALTGVEKSWPSQLYFQPNYTVKSVINSGNSSPAADAITDRLSTLKETGVDKLHLEGVYGKGVKVGLIDSGVDYLLPELGGGFGEGYLVSFGYDVVGDDYGSTGIAVPDDDPLTTCSSGGHGTHVAGIIAGRQNKWGYQGVAPNVTIGAYRIFSCDGGASDAVILDAFTRAATDGVDVINLSLGSAGSFWEDSPLAIAVESLISQGIVVVIAAGNSGQYGLLTNSIPAISPHAISVGSTDNPEYPYVWNATLGKDQKIEYASLDEWAPVEPITLTVWMLPNETEYLGYQPSGCESDFYPDDLPNPETTLVVLQGAGTCSPNSKISAALSVGMKYVLDFYGDDYYLPEPVNITYGQPSRVSMELLINSVAKNVTFFPQDPHTVPQSTGGKISYFSSEGPTWDLHLSPHISAPGGNILSSWPGGHAIISGTSMATPFVTGSVALLLSLKPSATPAEVKATIQRTAKPIPGNDDPETLQSISWQGAGLINAYSAYHYTTDISPSEILLNDTAHYTQPTITVINRGTFKKVYKISYEPALTISKWTNPETPYYWLPVDSQVRTKNYGTVHFGYETLTLGPGETRTFSPSFHPPTDIEPSLFPLYSGFIILEEDITDARDEFNTTTLNELAPAPEKYSIPFLGLAADMKKDIPIFEMFNTSTRWLPSIQSASGVIQLNDTVITFQNNTWADFQIWFKSPTDEVEIHLVPGSTFFKTTVPTFPKPLQNLPSTDPDPSVSGKPLASLKTIEDTYLGYLYQWEYSTEELLLSWHWNGNVYAENDANGTVITLPNAKYRIFVKALRLYGNSDEVSDWDTWLSPVITIDRPSNSTSS